jgi:glycosyltransferase involved in cell wall biosynthesis
LQAKRQDVELLLAYKQPYEMMPVYMNAADVFLFPSEREGSPQVIKEAMACNLPIVAAPVGDVPAVFDGVHGCYLAARNAEEIAERAYYILDNVQRSNGRTKIANYEGQYIARKIMQVYSSLVK